MKTLCHLLATLLPLAAAAEGDGLRVYHIGNSHTHSVRNVLMPLAIAAGHTNHTYSWSSILGAPLRWIYDHDKESGGWEGEPWSQGLAPDRHWDALTLQAYATDDREVDCAVKFAGLAYKGNPKCQVFLYTIWPGGKDDWEQPTADRSEVTTEKCAAAIAQAFPDAPPPRVLPTSLVMRELGRLADAGELPHVPSRFALLSDGGHLSDWGNYAVNITICAMLYNEPPFAYPSHIGDFKQRDKDVKVVDLDKTQYDIPVDSADVIKRVVWDVLSTYPPARMNVGLVIADRTLPAALVKQPYRHALAALNATGKGAWSLVDGKLPDGLSLSRDGLLAGTPRATGRFPIQVQVADGDRKFGKSLRVIVSDDVPPRIPQQHLPKIPLDRYLFHTLPAQGGVGPLTWTVADGRLPFGVILAKPGMLVGTPGEAGEFSFTVRVADSHPSGSRHAEQSFHWTIAPATPAALLVKQVTEAPTLDGKLDEPFWSLNNQIAKSVAGQPGKTASFGAVWQDYKDWRGGVVYLAVKVRDGSAGKTPLDAIHLFIDGMHNREVVYNQDDTHFIIKRDGKTASVKGKPNWFLKVAAAEIEGGYVLEMAVPSNYFLGAGNWLAMNAKAVYGFDIAVDEGDKDLSRQVWHGNAKNEDDTSGFGSLVLCAEGGAKK